jgi:hypothetical protein
MMVVTSAAFGAVHSLNVLVTGAPALALGQSVAAGMSGLLLLGLRLRCRSLWPAVGLHAAWDFGLFLVAISAPEGAQAPADVPPSAALVAAAGILPLFLYALWLVRRIEPLEPEVRG